MLLSQLKATSRWLERKLEQFFNRDATATTRVYVPPYTGYGLSPSLLDIEPVVSVSAVKVDTNAGGTFDETALAVTEYRLLPVNAAAGPEPRPYRQLDVTPWGSQGSWPATVQLQVTGIHGWPAVPEAIINATVEFTAMLRGESPFATGRITEMNQLVASETVSPQARAILKGLIEVYHPTGMVAVA